MPPQNKLHHRYGGAALVTGASGGLGEVFARRLAHAGFDLVLVARQREKLEQLAAVATKKYGVQCHIISLDLATAGSVDEVFARIEEGRIDIGLIVNNAGFGSYAELAQSDHAEQTAMVDLNCRAVLEVAHHGARILSQRRRGAMIITSSIVGHFSMPLMATYSATKHFDLALAEALWAELRPYGVDVQALCPGPTGTGFHIRAKSPTRTGLPMMTSAEVVDLSLRKLGKGPVVIPGFRNFLMVQALRRMPPGMRMRILSQVSRVGKNRAT